MPRRRWSDRRCGHAAPQAATEIITVRTTGDILADAPLDAIGGKGVFVKDIECRLLESRIDMAVHSLKDMQAILPESLSIGAFLPREDPRDMLFSCGGHSLDSLPPGSRIGTSSMRRRCQLRQVRPDLVVVDIRGNVTTRLGKVGASVDAVILAAAGVIRLGLPLGIAMDPGTMIPSPGQGIIAVECRAQDQEISEILAALDHAPTRACAEAGKGLPRHPWPGLQPAGRGAGRGVRHRDLHGRHARLDGRGLLCADDAERPIPQCGKAPGKKTPGKDTQGRRTMKVYLIGSGSR
ncbi:MAG: hydroxymethylbilane synthase [Desulfosudis oleivorans]|nr:hydroxymethylbilane synthase [Desulfosudis oleivorans]